MKRSPLTLLALLALLLPASVSAQNFGPPTLPNAAQLPASFNDPQGFAAPLNILSRLADRAAHDNPQFNQPMTVPAWTASTVYGTGEEVAYTSGSTTYYFENQFGPSCVSAASGSGPTSPGTFIADGTCLWNSVTVSPTGNAPTITLGVQYTAGTWPAGSITVTFSGSGASQTANFYSSSGGTTGGTPPAGTGTTTDGTITWTYIASAPAQAPGGNAGHSFTWNGGAGNITTVINMYGGTPVGTGPAFALEAATVNGSFQATGIQKIEFATDSPKFIVGMFQNGTGVNSVNRLQVCNVSGAGCRYVSPTHFGITGPNGFGYTLIDFTNAGGRAVRDFIYETGPDSFMGIFVAIGDNIFNPTSFPVLTMGDVGDSYPNGNGVMWPAWAYPQLVGDALGIRNVVNTAIGACGYADSLCASQGVLTRINDVIRINRGAGPDIILLSNGSNDMGAGESPAQIAEYQTLYIQALRANVPTRYIPIFVLGIYAHNTGGASCAACVAAENAEAAAVTALHDPNVFFCPWTTDPAGAWETGTGSITSQNGTGNTDFT